MNLEREEWIVLLRSLIPKAKVLLNKRILAKQAKEKADAEQRRRRNAEAVEAILRDSKRLTVRGSFKMYADALAERYQSVLAVADAVEHKDPDCSKQATIAIAGIVDSANSAAAICTNKAIQDELGSRTRDIATEVANLVSFYSALSGPDGKPVADVSTIDSRIHEVAGIVREQVQEALRFLAAASDLLEQLDRAKLLVEEVGTSLSGRLPIDNPSTEAYIELLGAKARALNEKLGQVSNRAVLEPHLLGAMAEETATLTRELLAAANEIALSCGVDLSLPDPFQSCSGTISEHQKQQLISMLNAAKGFAAATAGMIDILKQVPNQNDDSTVSSPRPIVPKPLHPHLRPLRPPPLQCPPVVPSATMTCSTPRRSCCKCSTAFKPPSPSSRPSRPANKATRPPRPLPPAVLLAAQVPVPVHRRAARRRSALATTRW